MQLSRTRGAVSRGSCGSRMCQTRILPVVAQTPLSGSKAGSVSNGTGSSSVPPMAFDRPAGGGSRSSDLPRSSDVPSTFWVPRSDIATRPSNGASRGVTFAAGSGDSTGSIERPGGRGGRSDMPSSSDVGSNPVDPAAGRPGGRGGRDAGLQGSNLSGPEPASIERPGGRGGRDAGLRSIDQPDVTPSIDRPGGRGGRDGPSGGDGGSSGGGGGSGGSSGDSGSSEGGGFSLGKGIGGAGLYAGVIAAAWFGHQMFFAEKQPAPAPVKPCCAGKGKK